MPNDLKFLFHGQYVLQFLGKSVQILKPKKLRLESFSLCDSAFGFTVFP